MFEDFKSEENPRKEEIERARIDGLSSDEIKNRKVELLAAMGVLEKELEEKDSPEKRNTLDRLTTEYSSLLNEAA